MDPTKPNDGQVVIEKTCAGGRCHASSAKGSNRVGVPAGLNFDVLPSDMSATEIARVTKNEKVVHENADAMWAQVDDGNMPPKNQGRTLSAADKETLRNWLACGAPVIKAAAVGGSDWMSIYTALSPMCVSCHGGSTGVDASPAGSGFGLGNDACTAYKNIVNHAAVTTAGAPACASSGLLLVVPNQPDMSLMLQKLEGTQKCGSYMPLTGTAPLDQTNHALVQSFRAWIMAGAMPPAGCM
jgi:hypothetical protein